MAAATTRTAAATATRPHRPRPHPRRRRRRRRRRRHHRRKTKTRTTRSTQRKRRSRRRRRRSKQLPPCPPLPACPPSLPSSAASPTRWSTGATQPAPLSSCSSPCRTTRLHPAQPVTSAAREPRPGAVLPRPTRAIAVAAAATAEDEQHASGAEAARLPAARLPATRLPATRLPPVLAHLCLFEVHWLEYEPEELELDESELRAARPRCLVVLLVQRLSRQCSCCPSVRRRRAEACGSSAGACCLTLPPRPRSPSHSTLSTQRRHQVLVIAEELGQHTATQAPSAHYSQRPRHGPRPHPPGVKCAHHTALASALCRRVTAKRLKRDAWSMEATLTPPCACCDCCGCACCTRIGSATTRGHVWQGRRRSCKQKSHENAHALTPPPPPPPLLISSSIDVAGHILHSYSVHPSTLAMSRPPSDSPAPSDRQSVTVASRRDPPSTTPSPPSSSLRMARGQ